MRKIRSQVINAIATTDQTHTSDDNVFVSQVFDCIFICRNTKLGLAWFISLHLNFQGRKWPAGTVEGTKGYNLYLSQWNKYNCGYVCSNAETCRGDFNSTY